ncbi:outer membrane efflux protein [Emticicia oligotrophica DSM 17448]|uniref:Outer membrane efflux protein n=1 Tax=Emticicia oligotrophica (strain DSM 17448 / CIP 109782 / MTCC 6937 / GPTSA100-15) TaxID=929562 RepID=A0ABN4AM79_EMTOG|nr:MULTISPECIES: TolC family protein [Emticicia]AFK02842.1 outer membrane efflux protein [Emticicia oligotrophica DSM 17448]
MKNILLKTSLISILLFAQCSFENLVFGQALSLKECVDIAIKNNLTYRESQILGESAHVELTRAKSSMYPQIGFGTGQDVRVGRSIDRFTNSYIEQVYTTNFFTLQASMLLYNGFQIKNQVRQNELLRDAGAKNIEAVKNRTIIGVLQAYLQVLATQELLEVSKNQVETAKAQVERVNKQVTAGVVGQTELFQVQSQLVNDEFALVTAQNNNKSAKLTLFQLMNQPPNSIATFEALKDDALVYNVDLQGIENIFEQAANNFPEIKAGELRLKSFDSQLKATQANNLPQVSLSGGYGTFYSSSNKSENYFTQLNGTRSGSLSLNVSIPILGRLQNAPRVSAVKVQKQLSQNQLNIVKLQLRQAIEQSHQLLSAASERYKVATNQVSILEQNIKAVESRINAGTVNYLEYMLAKTNFDRAKSNLVQAKYEFLLQKKILDFYRNGEWRIE